MERDKKRGNLSELKRKRVKRIGQIRNEVISWNLRGRE
jgi:hypothetical protein